jgi:inorganic pyrophosphatase
VLVIDVRDPLAAVLHDVADVERHLPGLLEATADWFRVYMLPDGRGPNRFAFGGRFRGRAYAEGVIGESGEARWRIVRGEFDIGDSCFWKTPP